MLATLIEKDSFVRPTTWPQNHQFLIKRTKKGLHNILKELSEIISEFLVCSAVLFN